MESNNKQTGFQLYRLPPTTNGVARADGDVFICSRTLHGLWPRRDGSTTSRHERQHTPPIRVSPCACHLPVGLPQSRSVGADEPYGAQLGELPLRRLEIRIWRGPEITDVALSAREVHALLGVGRLLAHVPFRAGFRLRAARCIADNVGLVSDSDGRYNSVHASSRYFLQRYSSVAVSYMNAPGGKQKTWLTCKRKYETAQPGKSGCFSLTKDQASRFRCRTSHVPGYHVSLTKLIVRCPSGS